MKKFLLSILLLGIVFSGGLFLLRNSNLPNNSVDSNDQGESSPGEPIKDVSILAENLEIPWDIAFLPDGDLLVTERPGKLTRISKEGTKIDIPLENVRHKGEGGLLGIVLYPDFVKNQFLYLYMTAPGEAGLTVNRVVRFKLLGNALTEEKSIIEDIPGAIYHDGGRMEFGPDGLLYITTGDATQGFLAQDKNSLAGKILRLTDTGAIPSGNPFGTAVYSYGHRNPQGITWDKEGRLWETEHGRSGVLSGLDEINLIKPGKNYGWPDIEGDKTKTSMINPVLHSGADVTWAPASAVYLDGNIFFGGLRGEALYKAVLDGEKIKELKVYFHGEFGRIRTVRVGPDKLLYLTTSNRDGRGEVQAGDDKIIRIDPMSLK